LFKFDLFLNRNESKLRVLNPEEIRKRIVDGGLKVTPQRMAVLGAIHALGNHPTAVQIVDFVRDKQPNIAVGTIYNTLDVFVERKVISKALSDGVTVRFDSVTGQHHHMYCMESGKIEDYHDEELNHILADYFRKKKPGYFNIVEIRLQLIGKFKTKPPK